MFTFHCGFSGAECVLNGLCLVGRIGQKTSPVSGVHGTWLFRAALCIPRRRSGTGGIEGADWQVYTDQPVGE